MSNKIKKIKGSFDALVSVPRRNSRTEFSRKLAKEISRQTGIPYAPRKKINGNRVLIVDDVIETGKTVKKVASKLKGKEISILTATKGMYFNPKKLK